MHPSLFSVVHQRGALLFVLSLIIMEIREKRLSSSFFFHFVRIKQLIPAYAFTFSHDIRSKDAGSTLVFTDNISLNMKFILLFENISQIFSTTNRIPGIFEFRK